MSERPNWTVTARTWNRKDGEVQVYLDPVFPEVNLRTPAGEMAGMNSREVTELMNHLGEALDELRRRE